MKTLYCVLLLAGVSLHCNSTQSDNPLDADVPRGTDAQTDSTGWRSIANVAAGPIQETAVAALDGKLYVLGGFNESLQLGSLLQVYDPENNSWTQASPLPQNVHHANMAAIDDKLYVLGAMNLDGFSFRAIGASYVYDPNEDQWTSIADMPLGTERGAAAVGVVDGKVYLAGGLRDGAVADFSSYDPVNDVWDTNLPSLPSPRDHLMGAVVGGRFYAIGGRDSGIESVMASVLAYSPTEGGGWQERADMPTARGGAGAGVVNGNILIVGGEGNGEVASGVFSQCESYDPLADEWTVLPPMRTPRHGMGAAGIGGSLYVPGGATRQGFAATAESESYTP